MDVELVHLSLLNKVILIYIVLHHCMHDEATLAGCSLMCVWLIPIQISGRTYRLRISNVGLQNSLNLRIVGHKMKLVEVEGTHTIQNTYSSLDIHVGQSLSVLISADQPPQDYYIVVSNLFTEEFLTSTAILHYNNSHKPVSGRPSSFHNNDRHVSWSLYQARSIRYIFLHQNVLYIKCSFSWSRIVELCYS